VINKWLKQPITAYAEAVASEIVTEHRLRWRLANLTPEKRTVRALADAWMTNLQISGNQITSRIVAPPSTATTLKDRSRLLEQKYLSLDSKAHGTSKSAEVDNGDDALLRGENTRARDEYLREVRKSGDLDAWIGFILVLRRLGVLDEYWSAQHPIEVTVAVHKYIQSRLGRVADIQSLVLWIIEKLDPGQNGIPFG
jgi:hypothetical protein